MAEILDEIMHYNPGLREIYRFKYGDIEGFYISIHLTYDGFLVYIEVTWFKPSKFVYGGGYEYSTIVCNYYSKSQFNDMCFDAALDIAEKLVREYPVRFEVY